MLNTRSQRLSWILAGVLITLIVSTTAVVGFRVRNVTTAARAELLSLGMPTVVHIEDPWTRESTYLRRVEEVLWGKWGVVAGTLVWPGATVTGSPLTDDEWQARLPLIRRLPRLIGIVLTGDINRRTVESLTQFPQLTDISLTDCPLTDADLEPLGHLPHLRALFLHDVAINGTGLRVLKESHQLQHLSLDGSEITEEGIDVIAELTQLRSISLSNVGLAESDTQRLADALPGVMISDD